MFAMELVRDSRVRLLYPWEMSDEWLKIMAILSEICVSVHIGFIRFHSLINFKTTWECRISRIPGGLVFSSPLSTFLFRNPTFPNISLIFCPTGAGRPALCLLVGPPIPTLIKYLRLV